MSISNLAEQATDLAGSAPAAAHTPLDPAKDVRGFQGLRGFAVLLRGAIPALAIAVLAAAVWIWCVTAPAFKARSEPAVDLPLAEGFLLTKVESQRLEQTDLVRNGIWAADLKPWQPVRSGIGGISYDAEQANAFNKILQKFAGSTQQRLDRAGLEQALLGLGRGNRGAVLHLKALAYYQFGQYDLAREQAEKALALIKAARGGARTDNARMRLDGEEIATRYLLGFIDMRQGKQSEAEGAFLSALNLAQQAYAYPPYYALPSATLFSLKPEYHLTDLSTATLWNDYLNAVSAKDPDRAWKTVQDHHLLDDPEGVRTSPYLAATLQLMAISHGRADLVGLLDAGPSPGRAGKARAAARLVAGLSSDLGPLANTPDEDLLRPWTVITQQRPIFAGAATSQEDAQPDPGTDGVDARDKAFIETWKQQYLQKLGQKLLTRGAHQNPAYLAAILKFDQFPAAEKFSAATRLGGFGPYLVSLILFVLALAFIAALGAFWLYVQAFWPLHYASRVAWARRERLRGEH